jgi:hypothetical protein
VGRETCPICGNALAPWSSGRGRPQIYCSKTCRYRARNLRELEGTAQFMEKRGSATRAAHLRAMIDERLAKWRA